MKASHVFTLVGIAALVAGAGLWLATRPAPEPRQLDAPTIDGAALYAASFRGGDGAPQSLGRFQDKWLVINFWATWCAPCREEMPLFSRLQGEWSGRGVQFVGLSAEAPELAQRFAREHAIDYPVWTGGAEVMELSRRLGNNGGVLPHTVIVAPGGKVVAAKVGAYNQSELAAALPVR